MCNVFSTPTTPLAAISGSAIRGSERLGVPLEGAGVEHALSTQWTIKAEYMFADFGSETYGKIDGDFDEPFSFDNQLHTVKIGLNYQF